MVERKKHEPTKDDLTRATWLQNQASYVYDLARDCEDLKVDRQEYAARTSKQARQLLGIEPVSLPEASTYFCLVEKAWKAGSDEDAIQALHAIIQHIRRGGADHA